MEPAPKLLSVADFLDQCPADQRHYELIGGMIVAMAPPGTRHQVIAGALSGEIYAALRRHRPECLLRAQAGIAPRGHHGRDYFEADLAVTCSPVASDIRGIATQPVLIVEILSPSTERDDVFIKLPAYQQIEAVQEILFVESERVGATVYRRRAGAWETVELVGPRARVQLESVGLDIPLSDLYRGL